ncbi:MAG: circadian clock KaiB family protein [Candidatus Moraniibacteriota bacterium]
MSLKKKKKIQLNLYITQKNDKVEKMIEELKKVLKELEDEYELEVVNISENPEVAEKEKILATPTLEKKLPLPVRRIIGDLSDQEGVLAGLDLVSK